MTGKNVRFLAFQESRVSCFGGIAGKQKESGSNSRKGPAASVPGRRNADFMPALEALSPFRLSSPPADSIKKTGSVKACVIERLT